MTSPSGRPTGDVLTETSAVAARLLRRTRYHLPEIVLVVALVWTLVALVALGGAFLEDAAIDGNRGTTAATVLPGSDYWRTLVSFVDDEGRLQTPAAGISYPVGLTPGENIYVEYDTADPTHVRVAGRTAVDGILPIAGLIAGGWVLLGPLYVWLRRRRARTGTV
ncbi:MULTISPECIES: DUF3592 domain-containing protein [unclassified Pseudonocardia]|uniref:DUF3592 domain-containing protein n=1 Tax=unclassified Pseudonocardia TaxID=2619320 RepID=UPI001115094E|nr:MULTISPECIES: DUF3592 domain-containing protein [unclassified Pseudonocardia]KAA1034797.1 DUF3592 domain-containing protein [Pseudonocardia sp. EV170527-09]